MSRHNNLWSNGSRLQNSHSSFKLCGSFRGNSLRPTLLTILRDLQRVEGAYQKRVGEGHD